MPALHTLLCLILLTFTFIIPTQSEQCLIDPDKVTQNDTPFDQAILKVPSFFTIHGTETDLTCDKIVAENVILYLVHDYAINRANDVLNSTGIYLSAEYADTCDNTSTTLQKVVGLMGASTVNCAAFKTVDNDKPPMIATTGVYRAEIGDSINYLFQAFCLPVIASAMSAAELDNPSVYPYFVRSSASDIYRARVIFDILQSQEWYHVNVIYDQSLVGQSLREFFDSHRSDCPIFDRDNVFKKPCIENYFALSGFGQITGDADTQREYSQLKEGLSHSKSRVIVLLMESDVIAPTINTIATFGLGEYQYVLSSRIDENITSLNYGFAVDEAVKPFKEMDTVVNITLDENTCDWVRELIEVNNLCCWENRINCAYSVNCSADMTITNIPLAAKREATHVFNAVMLLATAIKSIHEEYCAEEPGLCDSLREAYTGGMLLERLQNVSFIDDNGDVFLLFQRAAMPVFDVYQFVGTSWHTVMKDYNPLEGPSPSPENTNPVIGPLWPSILNESINCQKNCAQGEVLDSYFGDCCWTCRPCLPDQFVNMSILTCQTCPYTLTPNTFKNACIPLPEPPLFYKPTVEMDLLFSVALVGILLSLSFGFYIYRLRTTPMVLASTPDLLYIQTIAQVFLFITAILMLPSSSNFMCGAVWISATIFMLIVHAVFLIKAVRLSRPRFYTKIIAFATTPARSSALMLVSLTFSQLLICIIWVLLRPPSMHMKEHHVWVCNSNHEVQTVVLMILPLLLVILTFYFQRNAIRNKIMFQVRQARLGLAGTLCFIVNYSVLIPLVFMEDSPSNVRGTILMCVPLLTALVSWATTHLPMAYELTIRKKQNTHEFVSRERSRQFQSGNVVYYVDAMLLNRARSRAPTNDSQPRRP
uniref:G_PROTEIN_RECEP_F3_4 domain-containing protein n=1 Tax=Panagrellus redivivus TaxID=6233 RepID=A0A7E4ZUD0_PANRE